MGVEFENIIQELLSRIDPDTAYYVAMIKLLKDIRDTITGAPKIEVPRSRTEDYLQGIYDRLSAMIDILENIQSLVSAPAGAGEVTKPQAVVNVATLTLPIPAEWFKEEQTEEAITVEPSRKEKVLEVKVPEGFYGLWYEVGVTDADYSYYSYYIDGKALISNSDTPLGIFTNPYRFPHPLIFRDSVSIEVLRDKDAPHPEKYVARVRYIIIPSSVGERLLRVWYL